MTSTPASTQALGAASPKRRTIHRLIVPALAATALGLLLSCWGLATAPGGVPDDSFHAPLIWCGWGASETCVDSGTDQGYLVPTEAGQAACFIRKPNLSATCVYAAGDELAPAPALIYNNVHKSLALTMPYHRIMRVFVGTDAERSMLVLRLVNAWIAALVVGFALAVLQPALRRALALAWLVCLIPIGSFIIPSANPNSWTIIGIGTFWAFFLAWLTAPSWRSTRSITYLVGTVLTAGLALLARSDGALFLAMAGVGVAILAFPTLRQQPLRALVFLVPVPIIAWGLSVKVLNRLTRAWENFQTGAPAPDSPDQLVPGLNQWVNHLLELPTMVMGVVGGPQSSAPWPNQYFLGLGYLDTAIPTITSIFCAAGITAAGFWGLSKVSARKLTALGFLACCLVATIYVPIALTHFTSGNIQARYFLPLVLTIVGIACLIQPWQRARLTKTQAGLLAIAISIANAAVMLSNMRRYTNGEALPYFNMDLVAQWWWDLALPDPNIVWVAGALAGLATFALLAHIARTPTLALRRPARG